MHVAQVQAWGQPPVYKEVADLPPPTASQKRLKVLGSAVHRLVQARAAGKHYSAHTLPLDPSSDAVGRDETTGDVYYIPTFSAPAFADYVNVEASSLTKLPAGADPVTAAVLINPVTSGWMALKKRVSLPEKPGWSVLILGVTGTSGSAAVSVARHLGAGRIVGVARNQAAMDAIADLDHRIVLRDPPEESDFASAGPIDVVLDYVYGRAAAALLEALQPTPERETQYVDIGSLGAEETFALPAQLLRSKSVRLSGAGPGSWAIPALLKELPDMVELVAKMEHPKDAVVCPMKDVEKVWNSEEAKKKRLIMVP